ncbi:Transcription factor Dp-1 [Exaiptasia diaphana]|nr:Transcription factor Dp-1 [Exaiptasia diaphana]
MVLNILEEKEIVTIDEIFEIVNKEINGMDGKVQEILHTRKNVYRRLGDVLNSFDANRMISRDGRIVKWLGYPNYEEEEAEEKLKDEKQNLEKGIQEKTKNLEKLTHQRMCFKNLLRLKRDSVKELEQGIINLPFIAIRTDKNTSVECNVSSDELQYLFTFDRPFDILDNMEVLQKMDLSNMMSEDVSYNEPSTSNGYDGY